MNYSEISMKLKIVLASKSEVRKKLMKSLGFKFSVFLNPYKENTKRYKNETFEDVAKRLALHKANFALKKYTNAIIIGVDSFAVIDKKILGKPLIEDNIKIYLSNLSDRKHTFYSGIALINTSNNMKVVSCTKTCVQFHKLTSSDIENYIKRENVLGVAGAYKIQGLGSLFIKKITGDFYSVVGLPVNELAVLFKKVGSNIFDYIPENPKVSNLDIWLKNT